MLLPDRCSIKVDGVECQLPPAYTVSVSSKDGEYMLAVVCEDHRHAVEKRLDQMQHAGKIPKGRIKFQLVKMVTTDCVIGIKEDYVEIELQRGIQSDRVLD